MGQHPQGEEEEESRATGTVGTPIAAEPQEQHVLGAVAPIQKKSKTKSVCSVRDEEEAGSSQQEEDPDRSRAQNPYVKSLHGVHHHCIPLLAVMSIKEGK